MNKKNYNNLDVDIYYEKLENGLDVFIIPYEDRKNYFIEYGVKYGAIINKFISSKTKKIVNPPYGVAHFLEHKMFEQQDGIDPFSFYSKYGSDANAFTTYKNTSYTVDGIKNLKENLDFLLNYVNSPYFTDENVEKEKGIIIEELNMYKDQPENKLYDESNKAFFVKHPLRIDIGGTPSSVKKITKELLYECYDTFYQPNNMFLVISGKINPRETIEIIKNNKKLISKKNNGNIEIINVIEPINVKTKEKEIKIKNLIISKAILSFKSKVKKMDSIEKFKYEIALNILLYILFGMSSEFREDIYNQELCSLFYDSASIEDDLLIIEFLLESKNPRLVKEKIIEYFKNKEIKEEDVERVKKVKISFEINATDKPYRMLKTVINDIIEYNEIIYNKIDIIRSITMNDVLNVRKDILFDNYSFVVGNPKK